MDIKDEANEANLVFILNDYIRMLSNVGFDEEAVCGCCTNGDNAVTALYLLEQMGTEFIDPDTKELLEPYVN